MSDTTGNQGFAGQRGFTSGTGDYNKLEFIFRALLSKVATATLVKVVAVYPGTGLLQGTIDAQLLVNQGDELGNITPHGIVCGLPYSRVQAGQGALIIDPVVGDIGVAVFASRDITAVKSTLAQSAPGSFRRYNYADGIYLFSALSATQPTDYVQVLPGGGVNMADRFGNTIAMANSGITINGILFPRGGISFNAKTHTHNQPSDSHGDTEAPTNAPNNGS